MVGSKIAEYVGGGNGAGSGIQPSRFATRYLAGLRLKSRLIWVCECLDRVQWFVAQQGAASLSDRRRPVVESLVTLEAENILRALAKGFN
jgi:hypothetical protein